MKARITAGAVLAASVAFSASALAVTVTVGGTPGGAAGYHSSVPGVTTVDFFDGAYPAGWSLSGDGAVVSGSLAGYYAAPPNSGPNTNTSPYLTVPSTQSSGTAAIALGGYYNYYGLYWGSIDGYNTLSFWDGGTQVFSFSGSDAAALVPAAPNGEQSLAAYFNFFGLPQFNTVRLSSTSYAFETDNHAYGNVPTPGSLALLGLGGIAISVVRVKSRRRGE